MSCMIKAVQLHEDATSEGPIVTVTNASVRRRHYFLRPQRPQALEPTPQNQRAPQHLNFRNATRYQKHLTGSFVKPLVLSLWTSAPLVSLCLTIMIPSGAVLEVRAVALLFQKQTLNTTNILQQPSEKTTKVDPTCNYLPFRTHQYKLATTKFARFSMSTHVEKKCGFNLFLNDFASIE
jgi:hypothetical protein